MTTRQTICLISLLTLSAALTGCANLNDPYGQGGYGGYGAPYGGAPYGNAPYGYNAPPPYYGGPGYYNGYPNYQQQQQQRELDRERRQLEEERRRLERERDSYRAPNPPPPPASRPIPDRCPAGFSPSERKCSPQERRNGCRDIRLSSGLGCVSR